MALGNELGICESHVWVFRSGGNLKEGTGPKRGEETAMTTKLLSMATKMVQFVNTKILTYM